MKAQQKQFTMGTLDLEYFKEAFSTLIASIDPPLLQTFLMWVDRTVAEYKRNGYMYTGLQARQYEMTRRSDHLKNSYHKLERSMSYGISPNSAVQTEALELTKSPGKSKAVPSEPYGYPQDCYKFTTKSSHNDIAYPKEMKPIYKNHHSPVYGSEASGIINLSVKSSHSEESCVNNAAGSPVLKVPCVYSASSPAKPLATSPPPLIKSEPAKSADPPGYSNLRSLLEARKASDLPTGTSTVCASPVKASSGESSTVSSPGAELGSKDQKKTVCTYCDKTFQYRSSYRRHLKIHQGVYTHICAACNRKFTRKEHFVRHKCNRKPNIPNRSASRVEMTPEARLPSDRLPRPKVEFPPSHDEQQISAILSGAAVNSPVKNLTEKFTAAFVEQPPMKTVLSSACNESRRKKAQPRKLIVEDNANSGNGYMDEDEDVLKAYESPAHTPVPMDATPSENSPSSPEDLSMHRNRQPTNDVHACHPKPIEIVPDNMQSTETISTMTGTYQIEQGNRVDKCIKVTKQSNYLKLRKESQLVNGHIQYVCPHCSKVFHRSSNFSRHMRLHRGIFSYVCEKCNRGFYRREHFQKHKCTRRAMSHVAERLTKLDMAAVKNDEEMSEEKENLTEAEVLEAGVDLGSLDGEEEDYESSEEGALVVDESAHDENEEDMATTSSPLPPPVVADAN